jgi:DHA2 family methylenomycin A resistance protein-like MFS transporter
VKDDSARTESFRPYGEGMRPRTALYVAAAGYFFVLLDVTIVNVALARIGGDLGAPRSEVQWVVDAYAVVLAACMLTAGDLVDLLGSRRLFLAGLGLFGLGSAACAVAPGAEALIAARAAQGLGAAAILPTSLAIVNQLFPDGGERPRAIGIWAGVGGSALVLGPILGGLLVDPFGWRAIFWINVPLALIALGLAFAFIPATAPASRSRPDLAGQLLGTGALLALVFALIEGGDRGFGSPAAIVSGACALALCFAFALVELDSPRPMLDLRWFRSPGFSGANLGAALMNLGTLGALFAISLDLQDVHGLSPFRTGLNLIPLAAPLAILTPLTGRLAAAVGPGRPAGWGLLCCGCGYLGIAGDPSQLAAPAGWALLALAGVGMAVAVPGLVAGATEALGAERAGIAAAVNNTSRQVGGAIGVALIGGFASISAALAAAGVALLIGGTAALVTMAGGARPIPRRAPRPRRCPDGRPRSPGSAGGRSRSSPS